MIKDIGTIRSTTYCLYFLIEISNWYLGMPEATLSTRRAIALFFHMVKFLMQISHYKSSSFKKSWWTPSLISELVTKKSSSLFSIFVLKINIDNLFFLLELTSQAKWIVIKFTISQVLLHENRICFSLYYLYSWICYRQFVTIFMRLLGNVTYLRD